MSAENRTQWYQDVDHDLSSPGKTRPKYISKYDDNLDDGKDLGMGAPRVRYMVVCSDESCILVTKTVQVKIVIRWHLPIAYYNGETAGIVLPPGFYNLAVRGEFHEKVIYLSSTALHEPIQCHET